MSGPLQERRQLTEIMINKAVEVISTWHRHNFEVESERQVVIDVWQALFYGREHLPEKERDESTAILPIAANCSSVRT